MKKTAIILAGLLALLSLSACGESRRCLHSHVVTGVGTTLVPSGKTVIPVTTVTTTTVCDEYAPEVAK